MGYDFGARTRLAIDGQKLRNHAKNSTAGISRETQPPRGSRIFSSTNSPRAAVGAGGNATLRLTCSNKSTSATTIPHCLSSNFSTSPRFEIGDFPRAASSHLPRNFRRLPVGEHCDGRAPESAIFDGDFYAEGLRWNLLDSERAKFLATFFARSNHDNLLAGGSPGRSTAVVLTTV
jgi:hypothetical protein